MTHLDAVFQTLALDDTSTEASSKGIASAVGVIDLVALDDRHFVFLHLNLVFPSLCNGHNSRVRTLRTNRNSRSLAVYLSRLRHEFGILRNRLLTTMTLRLAPRLHLVLIPEHIIAIRHHLGQLVLEELRDKAGAETEHVDLVGFGGVFAEREGSGDAHGQVVAADVVDGGGLRPFSRCWVVGDVRFCSCWRRRGVCTWCGGGR